MVGRCISPHLPGNGLNIIVTPPTNPPRQVYFHLIECECEMGIIKQACIENWGFERGPVWVCRWYLSLFGGRLCYEKIVYFAKKIKILNSMFPLCIFKKDLVFSVKLPFGLTLYPLSLIPYLLSLVPYPLVLFLSRNLGEGYCDWPKTGL